MDTAFLSIIFGLGLIVGSFLNVVIARTRSGTSLVRPRSQCPACQHPIAWYDNIPLVSFLILRGRCRSCHESISAQYPSVELATGLIWLWLGWSLGFTVAFIGAAVISALLIVIFMYDLRWYQIPDRFSWSAAIVGAATWLLTGGALLDIVIGAAVGGGFFGLQYVLSRGRWIGAGDIHLGVAMGCILGWHITLVALGLAYITGSIVGLTLIALGRRHLSSRLPFGTFLAASTLVCMVYGQPLLAWYLGLLQ
jgi:prepilin signal peptidase PulO-like enzyme (type II secretory pathway)